MFLFKTQIVGLQFCALFIIYRLYLICNHLGFLMFNSYIKFKFHVMRVFAHRFLCRFNLCFLFTKYVKCWECFILTVKRGFLVLVPHINPPYHSQLAIKRFTLRSTAVSILFRGGVVISDVSFSSYSDTLYLWYIVKTFILLRSRTTVIKKSHRS